MELDAKSATFCDARHPYLLILYRIYDGDSSYSCSNCQHDLTTKKGLLEHAQACSFTAFLSDIVKHINASLPDQHVFKEQTSTFQDLWVWLSQSRFKEQHVDKYEEHCFRTGLGTANHKVPDTSFMLFKPVQVTRSGLKTTPLNLSYLPIPTRANHITAGTASLNFLLIPTCRPSHRSSNSSASRLVSEPGAYVCP